MTNEERRVRAEAVRQAATDYLQQQTGQAWFKGNDDDIHDISATYEWFTAYADQIEGGTA